MKHFRVIKPMWFAPLGIEVRPGGRIEVEMDSQQREWWAPGSLLASNLRAPFHAGDAACVEAIRE